MPTGKSLSDVLLIALIQWFTKNEFDIVKEPMKLVYKLDICLCFEMFSTFAILFQTCMETIEIQMLISKGYLWNWKINSCVSFNRNILPDVIIIPPEHMPCLYVIVRTISFFPKLRIQKRCTTKCASMKNIETKSSIRIPIVQDSSSKTNTSSFPWSSEQIRTADENIFVRNA